MVEGVEVVRNDDPHALTVLADADAVIFSPGPGLPQDSGCLMEAVRQMVGVKPVLGVCLGMQALGLHFGANLYHAGPPQHGVARELQILSASSVLFQGLPSPMKVGLYHSWAVRKEDLGPACVATSTTGVPMAAEWPEHQAYAVQFHPESVLTPEGDRILANWVKMAKG
ncbi:MAG: hypothetical protein RL168_581 [Bacteroidota bacterium]